MDSSHLPSLYSSIDVALNPKFKVVTDYPNDCWWAYWAVIGPLANVLSCKLDTLEMSISQCEGP